MTSYRSLPQQLRERTDAEFDAWLLVQHEDSNCWFRSLQHAAMRHDALVSKYMIQRDLGAEMAGRAMSRVRQLKVSYEEPTTDQLTEFLQLAGPIDWEAEFWERRREVRLAA